MSLLGLFDIGRSALFASQAALSVTSNNIANVNTPGYTRQDVTLSISNPVSSAGGYIGAGVTLSGVRRSYDTFLQSQMQSQQQSEGRSAAMDQMWGQIESVLNEARGAGLSTALSDYFNAWQDVASNPTFQPQRMVLLQKATALANTAQNIESMVLDTLKSANNGIIDATGQINRLAADIAVLNDRIVQQETGTTQQANEFRDQRDQKLNELSELVGISSYEDEYGSITVTVGMRNLVSGTRTSQLSAVTNADGNQELHLDGINITGDIAQGRISGLLSARDDIQANVLTGLRKLIASLTQQVNIQHRAGFGLDDSTLENFFNPLQQLGTTTSSAGATIAAAVTDPAALTLDEYRITFDAGANYSVADKQSGAIVASGAYVSGNTIALPGMDLVITGAVTSSDVFTVSPLTYAISGFGVALTDPAKVAAASALASPGDNANAVIIAQLASQTQGALGATFAHFYNGLVSTVGAMKQISSNTHTFDDNLLTAMKVQRDSVSGVSLDEEAANLIRYQRSYEAGARMIRITDELLQTILSL